MSESSGFVRGFGDASRGEGGLAWSLGGGGAMVLEGATATAVESNAIPDAPDGAWSFEAQLEDELMEGAAIFRCIALDADEVGTLVCTSVGAEGIPGHAEERTQGVLASNGNQVVYDEALISTQYDSAGDPTRFGLELWPPDADQTTRAAATRVSASLLGGARSSGAWAGLFRCHTDGIEGIGTYLLWRA